jgi:hypothetical protein
VVNGIKATRGEAKKSGWSTDPDQEAKDAVLAVFAL